jgi:Lytic transglycolase
MLVRQELSVVKTTSCRLTLGRAVGLALMAAEVLLAGCSAVAAPAVSSTGPANYVQPLRPSSSVPALHKSSRIVSASRYSADLAGNCISNEERYNPNRLTAASRSLPMGAIVKVTNVNNGPSVDARINDRGPLCSREESGSFNTRGSRYRSGRPGCGESEDHLAAAFGT